LVSPISGVRATTSWSCGACAKIERDLVAPNKQCAPSLAKRMTH